MKGLTWEQLDDLGIDEFNRLYWKGEQVVTAAMIDLPTWVDVAVGVAALAGAVIALIRVLEYFGVDPKRPKGSEEGEQT